MKKAALFTIVLLICLTLASCRRDEDETLPDGWVDATEHGVSTRNTGTENSKNLQKLIDALSAEGGTVYIPRGEYAFSENGRQTIGSHCIRMRSNVSIIGDGEDTVLMPEGESNYGLDMFYFNDYLDTGEAVYLENCRFESFTIDAAATSLKTYTSAGKGFMFNLFRDCHWRAVTVKNTDATGFGVDCPINSSMTDCIAISCGKAAGKGSEGASGFGIGFGYADGENMIITNCRSQGNRKFGFFFEHQGRFNSDKYSAYDRHAFEVSDCTASDNLYNFGGIYASDVRYKDCVSQGARQYGFYFENSHDSGAVGCTAVSDGEAAFAISQHSQYEVSGVYFERCEGSVTPYGFKITADGTGMVVGNEVKGCTFRSIGEYAVYTSGSMGSLTLTDNVSNLNSVLISDGIASLENSGNSWNGNE